jgi:glycosyltransferase involved in cell wall biosynthesis
MKGVWRPRISVVIPVFNGELYLRECLESLVVQNTDFECLIIDNGSTDRTAEIANLYLSKFPNIKYLRSKPRDLATALNMGVHNALGDLIARLDSDDIAIPGRLNEQLMYMDKHKECVLVGGRLEYINSSGESLGEQREFKSGNLSFSDFCIGNPVAHPSVMFRRKSFLEAGQYRVRWNGVEDLDLWIRLLKVGEIHNSNTLVTKYRIHPNQVSISGKAARKELTFRIILFLKIFPHLQDLKPNVFRVVRITGLLFPRSKSLCKFFLGWINERN